jgi:hypothetical protein
MPGPSLDRPPLPTTKPRPVTHRGEALPCGATDIEQGLAQNTRGGLASRPRQPRGWVPCGGRGRQPRQVACSKCDRRGRYRLARLIERCGRDAKLVDWKDQITADCSRRAKDRTVTLDLCGAFFPDLLRVHGRG